MSGIIITTNGYSGKFQRKFSNFFKKLSTEYELFDLKNINLKKWLKVYFQAPFRSIFQISQVFEVRMVYKYQQTSHFWMNLVFIDHNQSLKPKNTETYWEKPLENLIFYD